MEPFFPKTSTDYVIDTRHREPERLLMEMLGKLMFFLFQSLLLHICGCNWPGLQRKNPGMRQKRSGIQSEQVASLLDPHFFFLLSVCQYYFSTCLLYYHSVFQKIVWFQKIKLILAGTGGILGLSFHSAALSVIQKGWIRETKAFPELNEQTTTLPAK